MVSGCNTVRKARVKQGKNDVLCQLDMTLALLSREPGRHSVVTVVVLDGP